MPARRRAYVAVLLLVVVAATLTVLTTRARASVGRCERFAAESAARAEQVSGSGERVVVIGDSYSVGLGLENPESSWPSRLAGTIQVAGFSGSGFSAGDSPCGDVSFADRARAAVRGGADLVVVEGGLNDFDQSSSAVELGFGRLMASLAGHRVVVVGPASAPSRLDAVPRVDDLLATLADRYGVPYVRTAGLGLSYLPDGLHLTPAAHRIFGDYVAARVAALHSTDVLTAPPGPSGRPGSPRSS